MIKTVSQTYLYLTTVLSAGVGLALMCCGAPALWSGHTELHEEQMKAFTQHWTEMGEPEVILGCPTCLKMFQSFLPQVKIKTLWRVFLENPLPQEVRDGAGKAVALYDPCSSRYFPDMQKDVRRLLAKLNYKVEELKFNKKLAQCCSYGGLISTVNPNLARLISEHRIAASPLDYVTYCTNCRDDFAGKGKPAWHVLDVLFGEGQDRRGSGQVEETRQKRLPPTISQRRENRILLKQSLLEKLWGEKMAFEQPVFNQITLVISPELEEKIDRELILKEEIKEVVYRAETSCNYLIDAEAGHRIAHLQIGIITYWVEYYPETGGYRIINAYSHRMQIVEEGNRT